MKCVKCGNEIEKGELSIDDESCQECWEKECANSFWETFNSLALQKNLADIIDELHKATEQHPKWPSDMIHQAAILSEEAGELTKAVNDHIWKKAPLSEVRRETIQTGAMALRFLVNLPSEEKPQPARYIEPEKGASGDEA